MPGALHADEIRDVSVSSHETYRFCAYRMHVLEVSQHVWNTLLIAHGYDHVLVGGISPEHRF